MNVGALKSEIRFITKTDTSSFSDADILTGLNLHQGEIVQDILRVQTERNSQGNEVRYNLISTNGLTEGNLGYNGEYPFPADLLRPIRVEVSFDGKTWRPCSVYDISENHRSEYDQVDINNTFLQNDGLVFEASTITPQLRFLRDSFFIRPLNTGATVTNGIIVWYEQRQANMAVDADLPVLEANYHEILVLKGAIRYASRYPEKYNPLWQTKLDELMRSMKEYYKNRFKRNKRLTPSAELFR